MKKVSKSQVFSAKLAMVKAVKAKKASLGGLAGAKMKLDDLFGFEVSLTESVTAKVAKDSAAVEKAFAEVFADEKGDMARLEAAQKKAAKKKARKVEESEVEVVKSEEKENAAD